jgi:hypothetical protein
MYSISLKHKKYVTETINTRLPLSNPIMWQFEKEMFIQNYFGKKFWSNILFFKLSHNRGLDNGSLVLIVFGIWHDFEQKQSPHHRMIWPKKHEISALEVPASHCFQHLPHADIGKIRSSSSPQKWSWCYRSEGRLYPVHLLCQFWNNSGICYYSILGIDNSGIDYSGIITELLGYRIRKGNSQNRIITNSRIIPELHKDICSGKGLEIWLEN